MSEEREKLFSQAKIKRDNKELEIREELLKRLMHWELYRHQMFLQKKALVKNLKRSMKAKRFLVFEKCALFIGKCKEIYAYVKLKKKRMEA